MRPWSRQYEKFIAEPEIVFMLGGGNTVFLVCLLAGLGSTDAYKVKHSPSRPAACLCISAHAN